MDGQLNRWRCAALRIWRWIAAGGFLVIVQASLCKADEPGQIPLVVEKAKAFLFSQEHNGNWESTPTPSGQVWEATGGQWGGRTALVTYALLADGVSPRDPQLQPAIQFLRTADLHGTYAIGLRALVWNTLSHLPLPDHPSIRQSILRDRDLLISGMKTVGPAAGMFDYLCDNTLAGRYDHSASQYGVLGLWACEDAGADLPDAYWEQISHAWRRDQLPDGGWAYQSFPSSDHPESVTFTASGIASLLISDDNLQAGYDPDAQRGLQWLTDHFSTCLAGNSDRLCYGLYAVERAGIATGRKYFGSQDWYRLGARKLFQTQRADGSWDYGDGSIPDTAFAMLFMVRGRQPILMNKLDYSLNPNNQDWNARPRDVAHFTHWMSGEIEARNDLLWQIVTPEGTDWNDSRVLYISGAHALHFPPSTQSQIKAFADRGGLVLCNADGASPDFTASMKELGTRLWGYEFRPLPADHPIFTVESFPATHWPARPSVLGLSNGARELMLIVPQADLSRAWQAKSEVRERMQFELSADIMQYAAGRRELTYENQSAVAALRPDRHPTRTIRLARLQYPGPWNPEPGGWQQLTATLHNDNIADLSVEPIPLGSGKLDPAIYPIAHLTGTARFHLTPQQRAEMANYVNHGGTLIIDAAGGNPDFAASTRAELQTIFGSAPIPADATLFRGIGQITLTDFARVSLAPSDPAQISQITIAGRPAVFFSPADLSVGLLGQPVDGIIGYDPPTATALMRRIILRAAGLDQ